MNLWRTFALDEHAENRERGGALWFPREDQGDGRHDNPDLYGCLYVAERPLSTVVEALAAFRGAGPLTEGMLMRHGRALALVELELDEPATVIDLDDPAVLQHESLRPSGVATREREITQAQAARLHEDHGAAAGVRWWSTLEASWINVTLFDRAADRLAAREITSLSVENAVVAEAVEFLGLSA